MPCPRESQNVPAVGYSQSRSTPSKPYVSMNLIRPSMNVFLFAEVEAMVLKAFW